MAKEEGSVGDSVALQSQFSVHGNVWVQKYLRPEDGCSDLGNKMNAPNTDAPIEHEPKIY